MEDGVRAALRASRERFQRDVYMALCCKTKKEKRALLREWEGKYSPTHIAELIRCVKNKKVAGDILDWNLDEL